MLWMYVVNNLRKWEDYFHLVEFACSNGYQISAKMRPFKVLYGWRGRTPVTWDILVDRIILGHDLFMDLEELVTKVHLNLKEAQDHHKSYANWKGKDKYFQVRDDVYLKVKDKWSSLSLGRCGKLAPIFCGPFEMLAKKGPVAYELALPTHVRSIMFSMHIC